MRVCERWCGQACHTYLKVDSLDKNVETYVNMTKKMIAEGVPTGLSASIYTQITDVRLPRSDVGRCGSQRCEVISLHPLLPRRWSSSVTAS